MKKIISLLMCVAMLAVFAACTTPEAPEAPEAPETPVVETPVEEAPVEETPVEEAPVDEADSEMPAMGEEKTGLAVITDVAKSASATADAEGKAQANSVVVAVTLDANGVITNCVIDMAQTAIKFDAMGMVTTDPATEFKTKQELGTDYGMLAASGIGKEWFEQADALAAYVTGKTIDGVKGIALTEDMHAVDADLAAMATVSIGGYLDGVVKAAENAVALGAMSGDKLGIGVVTSSSKSKDATADAEGQAQAYSHYAAVTVNAEGKVTSCIIDASQATVKFDATGTITNDLTAPVMTKNELGAGYGMINASAIGKEWNEQAASFAMYCTGKTVDEVKGIAVNEEGRTGDADLMASVTVHIGDFINVVEKAAMNSKAMTPDPTT